MTARDQALPPQGLVVVAPIPGRVLPMEQVPDPVFAQSMVGPGTAIDPPRGPVEVAAPVTGQLIKMHPHAFVVATPTGVAVLVHLGLDTVRLQGDGFTLLAAEGDHVHVGQPIVRWDTAAVEAHGYSPICPIVALEAPAIELADEVLVTATIKIGEPLFVVPVPDAGATPAG